MKLNRRFQQNRIRGFFKTETKFKKSPFRTSLNRMYFIWKQFLFDAIFILRTSVLIAYMMQYGL